MDNVLYSGLITLYCDSNSLTRTLPGTITLYCDSNSLTRILPGTITSYYTPILFASLNDAFVYHPALDVRLYDATYHTFNSCSICLTEYCAEDKVARLKCTHCYCEGCILECLKHQNKCPICRAKVE